ncbi:MAG: N-acetylneuraminate lyase [Candidatus Latescibacterota bacterium]|jgi:N-acetylneuraminate lyase
MKEKLARGIWPALVTPFTADGSALAPERVAPLVRHLLDQGSNGFFVTGGTGEGAAMRVDERKIMTETTIAAVAGAVPLIFQVGGTSTENAVELARHAAAAGTDAIASVAPVDHPNNLQAAVDHYSAIGAASDKPFYVYWIAQTADRNITAEQYLEAMAGVPNFSGLKFTDSNFYLFQRLVDLGAENINLISGPDEICLGGMVAGADAAIGSTYNIMPKIFLGIRRHFDASEIQPAMELQARANRVISIFIRYGVIASIKAVLAMRGFDVGIPRAPHNALDSEAQVALRAELDALDFVVE